MGCYSILIDLTKQFLHITSYFWILYDVYYAGMQRFYNYVEDGATWAKPIPVLGRALGDLKQGNVRRRVARNVMLAA